MFVHNGSLSEKIERDEMNKIFVALILYQRTPLFF